MGMKIDPLDSDASYHAWRVDVEALLVIKGCEEAIDHDDGNEMSTDEKKRDRKARAYIVSNVCARIKKEICDLPSAAAMWRRLEERYRATVMARRLRLQRELSDIRMQNGEGVDVYFSRARGLIADLRAAGDDVSDESALPRVLEGLSQDFATFVDFAILNFRTLGWTWDDAVHHLLEAEARQLRRTPGSAPPAAAALNVEGKDSNRESRTCYYCGKKGHIKKNCRKLKRDNQQNKGRAPGQGTALSVMSDNTTGSTTRWILDSGATDHMTGHRHMLTDYLAFKHSFEVACADGRMAHAVGAGDLHVETTTGEPLLFRRVLYVPDLWCNLLSTGRMDERGAEIVTKSGMCRINVDGRSVLTVKRGTDGLYSTTFHSEGKSHAMIAAKPTPLELWHARLGHVGEDAIKYLASKRLVEGLVFNDNSKGEPPCNVCPQAKQPRRHFPASSSQASRPMELVHSDLMEMPITSRGGARYVVTLLDDHSRLSMTTCVARKSMTVDAIADGLAHMEMISGHRTSRLRSDNGGEYTSRRLQQLLKTKNVIHEVSAPYTPEQNGRAERLNRTLMDRVRAMMIHSGVAQDMWAEAITTANYIRNRCPSAGKPVTLLRPTAVKRIGCIM